MAAGALSSVRCSGQNQKMQPLAAAWNTMRLLPHARNVWRAVDRWFGDAPVRSPTSATSTTISLFRRKPVPASQERDISMP